METTVKLLGDGRSNFDFNLSAVVSAIGVGNRSATLLVELEEVRSVEVSGVDVENGVIKVTISVDKVLNGDIEDAIVGVLFKVDLILKRSSPFG